MCLFRMWLEAAAITKVLTNIMKGVKTVLFSCMVVTATVDVMTSASKLSNYCNRNFQM